MIQIFLCDDSEFVLTKYAQDISNIAKQNNISANIRTFLSGEQLLFNLETDVNEAEIIYLDVVMTGMNGIAAAKKLREAGSTAEIIFLTANEQYVFESFDVDPLNYILKNNFNAEHFETVFLRAVERALKKEKDMFMCKNAGVVKRIPYKSISRFEVRNRIVTVFYDNESFDFYSKLEAVAQELPKGAFVRCHRSHLVNAKQIKEVRNLSLHMLDGAIIPIGPAHIKPVIAVLDSLSNQPLN